MIYYRNCKKMLKYNSTFLKTIKKYSLYGKKKTEIEEGNKIKLKIKMAKEI